MTRTRWAKQSWRPSSRQCTWPRPRTGEFSPVERAHFLKSIESLTTGRLPTARLAQLVAEASEALLREGREARLLSVKSRLPDKGSRRVALSMAVQVTAADGIIRTSERELIMDAFSECSRNMTLTAKRLGIPRSTLRDRLRKFGVR